MRSTIDAGRSTRYADGGPGEDEIRGHAGYNEVFGRVGGDFDKGMYSSKIFGGGGADYLASWYGNDVGDVIELHGGSGEDSIRGASGDASLLGDDGDDPQSGEGGFDTLNGGRGTDKRLVGPGGGTATRCGREV